MSVTDQMEGADMCDDRRQPELRLLCEIDSLADLTALLHRAYKPLADAGMRFVASYQDEQTTRDRAMRGECWVATIQGRIIGTIVMYTSKHSDGCAFYSRPDVARFGQYAVDPGHQGRGIGTHLMNHIEQRARLAGAAELCLDTSENATQLIEFYARRGFRKVDTIKWDEVNYKSVVMSKRL